MESVISTKTILFKKNKGGKLLVNDFFKSKEIILGRFKTHDEIDHGEAMEDPHWAVSPYGHQGQGPMPSRDQFNVPAFPPPHAPPIPYASPIASPPYVEHSSPSSHQYDRPPHAVSIPSEYDVEIDLEADQDSYTSSEVNQIAITRAPTHMPYLHGNEAAVASAKQGPPRRSDREDLEYIRMVNETSLMVDDQEIKLRNAIRNMQSTNFEAESPKANEQLEQYQDLCVRIINAFPSFPELFDVMISWGDMPDYRIIGINMRIWTSEDEGFKRMGHWKKERVSNVRRNKTTPIPTDKPVMRHFAYFVHEIIRQGFAYVSCAKEALERFLKEYAPMILNRTKTKKGKSILKSIRTARLAYEKEVKAKKFSLKMKNIDDNLNICFRVDKVIASIDYNVVHQLRVLMLPPNHADDTCIPELYAQLDHFLSSFPLNE